MDAPLLPSGLAHGDGRALQRLQEVAAQGVDRAQADQRLHCSMYVQSALGTQWVLYLEQAEGAPQLPISLACGDSRALQRLQEGAAQGFKCAQAGQRLHCSKRGRQSALVCTACQTDFARQTLPEGG